MQAVIVLAPATEATKRLTEHNRTDDAHERIYVDGQVPVPLSRTIPTLTEIGGVPYVRA